MSKSICTVAGCDRPHEAKGYCRGHYQRLRKGEPVDGSLAVRVVVVPTCSVDVCDKPHYAKGYCEGHYKRLSRGVPVDGPLGVRGVDPLDRLVPDGDCMIYPGGTNGGYGWNHKYGFLHRLAWSRANGPIPPGGLICHTCDNPPCCNPDHLYLGNEATNGRDMSVRGRAPHSKLTRADVLAIRSDTRRIAEVAAAYGVSRRTIDNVRARLTYKHF